MLNSGEKKSRRLCAQEKKSRDLKQTALNSVLQVLREEHGARKVWGFVTLETRESQLAARGESASYRRGRQTPITS